jgi:hypothetical protein
MLQPALKQQKQQFSLHWEMYFSFSLSLVTASSAMALDAMATIVTASVVTGMSILPGRSSQDLDVASTEALSCLPIKNSIEEFTKPLCLHQRILL